MASYTAQASLALKTLAAAIVDTVTITGLDVTTTAAGPAAPPYATANADRVVGAVLGAIVRNRSTIDVIHVTYGRTTPTSPNSVTPVDGQVILDPGDVFDIDAPGEQLIIKLLSTGTPSYAVIGKIP